jgi:hypothetical protein
MGVGKPVNGLKCSGEEGITGGKDQEDESSRIIAVHYWYT